MESLFIVVVVISCLKATQIISKCLFCKRKKKAYLLPLHMYEEQQEHLRKLDEVKKQTKTNEPSNNEIVNIINSV